MDLFASKDTVNNFNALNQFYDVKATVSLAKVGGRATWTGKRNSLAQQIAGIGIAPASLCGPALLWWLLGRRQRSPSPVVRQQPTAFTRWFFYCTFPISREPWQRC